MNGEKPPVTKTMNFLMLPDDLIFSCLARVSRLFYPTLSLVSKRFSSVLASTGLYQTRTLLGCTESCLYVALSFRCEPNPTRFFTLCRRPTQISNPNPTLNPNPNPNSSDNLMISVSTCNSYKSWWNIIAVGHNIYMIISGYLNVARPSSTVFSMDCRTHTWQEAPSMRVVHKSGVANVLDGKIYVVDKSRDHNPSILIECFDPKTKIWEHVPSPDTEIVCGNTKFQILAIEGKLYLLGNNTCVVYKPDENRWEVGLKELYGCYHDSSCVIDNVLYTYGRSKKLEWFDFEGRSWRKLKGVRKQNNKLPNSDNRVKLVDYGGKIAVLWEKYMNIVHGKKKIWCAEISLERRNEHIIYGKVEWCDVVLTVPNSCCVLKLLTTTV